MQPIYDMPLIDNTLFIYCLLTVSILLGLAGLALITQILREHSVH